MKLVTELPEGVEVSSALKSVLLVENEPEAVLARHELKRVGLRTCLQCVDSAGEMIAYLYGIEPYEDREKYPMPSVIILDLRLPGVDGLEAETWLRTKSEFRAVPLIVMGTKDLVNELILAVQLGADGWMLKPFNGDDFQRLAADLDLDVTFEGIA